MIRVAELDLDTLNIVFRVVNAIKDDDYVAIVNASETDEVIVVDRLSRRVEVFRADINEVIKYVKCGTCGATHYLYIYVVSITSGGEVEITAEMTPNEFEVFVNKLLSR